MEWSKAKDSIATLKGLAANKGRDPSSLEFSLFERSLPDEKTIADMESVGVKRIILTILAGTRDEALPALDRLGIIIR